MRHKLRNRYKNSDNFVIKIRKNKNDIVYYKGIKAFEITTDSKNKTYISAPDSVYKINAANISEHKEKIIDLIVDLRQQNVFKFDFEKVILRMTPKKYDENTKIIIDKMWDSLTPYISYIDNVVIDNQVIDVRKNNIETIKTKIMEYFNIQKQNYDIKVAQNPKFREQNIFYSVNINLTKNIEDSISNEDKKIEDMVNMEYIFSKYSICGLNGYSEKNNGLAKPLIMLNESLLKKHITEDFDLDEFDKTIKKSISSYIENTGTRGKEKRYQHEFMLDPKVLKDKGLQEFESLYRFEEEYYTIEGAKNPGRIDCVFVHYSDNVIDKVYLIELKVDDDVLGKSNGLNKHFIDIKKLYDDNLENFSKTLSERVSYSLDYENENIILNVNNKTQYYFYTIIALTNTENKLDNVIDELDRLNDINNIKVDTTLPEGSKEIKEHLEDITDNKTKFAKVLVDPAWNSNSTSKYGITNSKFIDITEKILNKTLTKEDIEYNE